MGAKARGRINTASHSPIPLTARDVEALFLRRAATPAQMARVGHALEEITLQTLAALNAAAIGRTDALISLKPEDGADIEAVLVGLRFALALLPHGADYGDDDTDGRDDGDYAEESWPDDFEDEEETPTALREFEKRHPEADYFAEDDEDEDNEEEGE